jgi:hypothetical protein
MTLNSLALEICVFNTAVPIIKLFAMRVLVQDPTTSPSGDLIPTIRGSVHVMIKKEEDDIDDSDDPNFLLVFKKLRQSKFWKPA